jgi:hypothetical protein
MLVVLNINRLVNYEAPSYCAYQSLVLLDLLSFKSNSYSSNVPWDRNGTPKIKPNRTRGEK